VRKSLAAFAISILFCAAAPADEPGEHPDAIVNGGFEEGDLDPAGWRRDAYQPAIAAFAWDGTEAYEGGRSIMVSAPTPNDVRWLQTITVEPNTNYLLSGWIRTAGVTNTQELVNAGANLSIYGTYERSAGVFGTTDWTYVRMVFHSGPRTQVEIGARLGFWAGTATGTAWFDDVRVTPILPTDPHPGWKILVLIYGTTDFRYVDGSGAQHHVTASMTDSEKQIAASTARRFVLEDIPLLTSGNMIPTVEVRFPARPLTELSPLGGGWWPAPGDTGPELDPAFDSVLVVWDPSGVEETTGRTVFLGDAAGLALPKGVEQTYATVIVDGINRNLFKHEWGHSILFFYQATGTAPLPAVNNHATPPDYVNCMTGQLYVWIDETDSHPIPSSIYNSESGFTHDYYSGTTALSSQPDRCIGITPGAWATGGPVSQPSRPEELTPLQQIGSIRERIDDLVAGGTLEAQAAKPLQAKLDAVARALERGQENAATNILQAFGHQVKALVKTGRLDAAAGLALLEAAQDVIDRLASA
jgi:hypothetical protein